MGWQSKGRAHRSKSHGRSVDSGTSNSSEYGENMRLGDGVDFEGKARLRIGTRKKSRDFKNTRKGERDRVQESAKERETRLQRRERRKRRSCCEERQSGDGVTSYHNNQSNNSTEDIIRDG